MTNAPKLALAFAALTGLGACMEGMGDNGLSGTPDQFAMMTQPCISQASHLTGVPQKRIQVLDQLQTGGGPLLTLKAGRANLSCRLEADGSVTVFSEYAN